MLFLIKLTYIIIIIINQFIEKHSHKDISKQEFFVTYTII